MELSFNYSWLQLLDVIASAVGMWFIFGKSKIKKWWTFVPVARDFQMAKCADCEEDASAYMISSALAVVMGILYEAMDVVGKADTLAGFMLGLMAIVFVIIMEVYRIRIYAGFCHVYEKKKIWIALWFISEGITACIWGISDKFKPHFIAGEADEEDEGNGQHISALKEGLTINIKKRTARKGFVKKTMLKDIHLAIEPGKMVLLLGGSGAGKTTFFNAITGYEKADATITLNGTDIYKHFDKMKYDIGFVPQQDLIRVNDTVYRTLMDSAMLRLPNSVSRNERHKRVEEVMELFGLSALRNNIVAKQSGGQKKRISIATEYISDPALFILDEPDSGLDGILARELMQRLHDISREGKIVIVITHTPDRVIDLFDQIIVLAKDSNRTGRLVYYGDIDEAKQFFGRDKMEDIVKMINRPDEGGEGKTDELVVKYEETRNGSK